MNTPAVSLVLNTYNRARLLRNTLDSFVKQSFKDFEVVIVDDGDDTVTPKLVEEGWSFPITYHRMNRVKKPGYGNPARPNNVGIRLAKAETIILQNAECMHSGNEVIYKLRSLCDHTNAAFAQVQATNALGGFALWYCHKTFSPRPFFFCGALRKSWFEKLRGFDEDYEYYGMDDVDFADRLTASGVRFDYTDVEVTHQFHGYSCDSADANNQIPIWTYKKKTEDMAAGLIGVERNLGREWGQP